MKAWVRNCSERERSCQEEVVSSFAFILAFTSESRWSAGTDDLTHLAADIAEAVWELTGEIISLAGPEYARASADRQLDSATHDDAGLFTAMGEHFLTGRGAGGITLLQDRELPSRALRRDET